MLAEERAIDFYLFYSIFIYFLSRAHKTRALGATLEPSRPVRGFFPWLVRGLCVVGATRVLTCLNFVRFDYSVVGRYPESVFYKFLKTPSGMVDRRSFGSGQPQPNM